MSQRESRLQRKIQKALRAEWPGLFVFKVWGNEQMMAGLPDLIICIAGRFVGFEVKMPESRSSVSPRQQLVHGEIIAAGGWVRVVSSVEDALSELRGILAEPFPT